MAEIENEERVKKYSVIPLLIAFAVVTKLYLRAEPVNAELKELMPSSEYSQLKTASNPPLEITLCVADYIQQQIVDREILLPQQAPPLQMSLNNLVESLIDCQRLLTTAMPLAYAIHLKQLLLLFGLLLPFQ